MAQPRSEAAPSARESAKGLRLLQSELRQQPVSSVMTREVYFVTPETALTKVAAEMHQRQISCVPVCADRKPVGIISERDVVAFLGQERQQVAELAARDVMTSPVQTIGPDLLCPDVMEAMRTIAVRRFPIVGSDGRMLGLVTQTDLLRASEKDLSLYSVRLERAVEQKTRELEKLSELKDDLTDLLVHDLKNPLAVILGILESVVGRGRKVGDARLQKRLALGLEAAQSMLRMVLNLLDITKLETGELKPRRRPIECRELLQRAIRQMSEIAVRDSVTVELVSVPAPCTLLVDESLMERVLLNLLSNAIKFSPSRSPVLVGAEVRGDFICLTVTNQGKPIPKEFHRKIFDKFAQLEAKKSGNVASTGLGLTFCQLAVEAHQGQISVESPVPELGEGARFVCSLPRS